MNSKKRWLATVLAVGALSSSVPAAVLHVPLEYPTIQAGIDASVNGDTVLVADGTYGGVGNRDIDFCGKAILLTSQNGPEATLIDCGGIFCRGLYFHSGEDTNSVVRGFTIENANETGIYCWHSSPTIAENIIRENTGEQGGGIACEGSSSARIVDNVITCNAADYGGAIYCYHSCPVIVGNAITENSAYDGGGIFVEWQSTAVIAGNTIRANAAPGPFGGNGGGICIYRCSPVIEENIVQGNVADYGGGIRCWNDSPIIRGNAVVQNAADRRGGGICCDGSSAILEGNTIRGNAVYSGTGGGISCSGSSSPTILGNAITDNNATESGGGIRCQGASAAIGGNTITHNRTYGTGGGLAIRGGSVSLYSNTMTDNAAGEEGGGIYCYSSSLTIINSIVRSDSAGIGKEIYLAEQSWASISYSNTESRFVSVYVGPGCTMVWGDGNIDRSPGYVMPERRDYRLLWRSPCIDAGHPDSLDPDITRRDIGAHYFNQADYLTLYVTPERSAIERGSLLRVTYSMTNRWSHPESFWVAAEAVLPDGDTLSLGAPLQHVLSGHTTAQFHITHFVPMAAPLGTYRYRSGVGVPSILYDHDEFACMVVEAHLGRARGECRDPSDGASRFRAKGR